jgi:hypothetical protein
MNQLTGPAATAAEAAFLALVDGQQETVPADLRERARLRPSPEQRPSGPRGV